MVINNDRQKFEVNPATFPDHLQQSDELFYDAAKTVTGEFSGAVRLPLVVGSMAVSSELLDRIDFILDNDAAKVETKETLTLQLNYAYQGNMAMVGILNGLRSPNKQIPVASKKEFATEFKEWFNTDRQRNMMEAQAANSNLLYILQAAPNVYASARDIVKSAKAFEQKQPLVSEIRGELIGKYNNEKLSGTDPENGKNFVFSFMPNSFTPGMEGKVSEQRAKLAELKWENPYLKVPSVLDAITYWHTLRAHGDQLTAGKVFERTYIRHFDLPKIRLGGGWDFVLSTYVADDGRIYEDISVASGGYPARLALG